MSTQIINLTPHAITVVDLGTIAPTGTVARVEMTRTPDLARTAEHRLPVSTVTYGAPTDLPGPVPGTVYLVSALVRAACPDRLDVLSPGDLVRDDAGRVVGCRGFDGN